MWSVTVARMERAQSLPVSGSQGVKVGEMYGDGVTWGHEDRGTATAMLTSRRHSRGCVDDSAKAKGTKYGTSPSRSDSSARRKAISAPQHNNAGMCTRPERLWPREGHAAHPLRFRAPLTPFTVTLRLRVLVYAFTRSRVYVYALTHVRGHPPRNASSMAARLKLAVSRLMPMPSVIVSKGLRSRLPSASSYVYITPRLTWGRGERRCGGNVCHGGTGKSLLHRGQGAKRGAKETSVGPRGQGHGPWCI